MESDSAFVAVQRDQLPELVADQILGLIQTSELAPGERLPSERQLTERLGISRSSLREGLKALSVMGVLESRHGSGTYVSGLDSTALVDRLGVVFALSPAASDVLLEARLAIEPSIAALAAAKGQAADHEELRRQLGLLREHVTGDEIVAADARIHDVLLTAARNPVLERLMLSIHRLGVASRRTTTALPGRARHTLDELDVLVGAVIAGDEDAAASAMRVHLERVRTDLHGEE